MQIQELRTKLIQAANAYYNDSNPIMTDEEFDILREQLINISPNDPFLHTIGAPVPQYSPWQKAQHKIPMGSLGKVKNIEEFEKWFKKNYIYTVTEKLDGISIDLEYENGIFTKGITRGDGKEGEDITPNVQKMQGFKERIPNFTGSIRGEILFTVDNFEHINNVLEMSGEPHLKTMRNGASGIAKRRDGKYAEFLTIIFYDVTGDFEYKHEKLNWLSKRRLKSPFVCNSNDLQILINTYKDYEHRRNDLNYEIDGLVVEISNINIQKEMGYDPQGNPKFARAWKFGAAKKETIIYNVIWQVGKSGRITPVAQVKPIKVGGVTVEFVSLHNISIFKELKLNYEDTVLISRRNDVIPYLEKVVWKSRESEIEVPEYCSVCNGKLVENGKYLECQNAMCEAKALGNLKAWIKGLNLKGIAESTIERLYDANLIKIPSDFYDLKIEDIEILEGFGRKSAENIVNTIQSKRNVTLQEFIAGVNIANFGSRMTDILVENGINTFSKISMLSHDKENGIKELIKLKGIEQKTAESFINGISEKMLVLVSLIDCVKIIESEKLEVENMSLQGFSFVFTGKIESVDESGERYTRKKLQEMVQKRGGETPSSIKKGVTYLVQADPNSSSSKTKKAQDLGVKIIGEEEFFKIIG